jgi:hypothetical protein
MTPPTPQRPPSERGVTYHPAKRPGLSTIRYGIDRYLGEEELAECLVEDYLTKQQAEWICATLNAAE